MNVKTPCIVYMRSRLDQARANHFAQKQQVAAEEALDNRGFEIVGRYGDEEFAPPFSGRLEPRPAWQLAVAIRERFGGAVELRLFVENDELFEASAR